MPGPVLRKVKNFVILSLHSSEIRRQNRVGLKEKFKFTHIDTLRAMIVIAPPSHNIRGSV